MQLKAVIALLAAAGAAMAQTFSMNTPTTSIIACVPLLLSWTGGQGPYTLVVHTFAGSVGPVIDTIGNVNGNTYTYTPKPAQVGQQLEFQLTDSTGAVAQTANTAAVLANSQCSGSSSSAAGSSSAASSSSSAAGGAAPSSSSHSSAAPSSSSSSEHRSSSAAAPSSSSSEHRSSSSAAPSSSSSEHHSSAGSSSAATSSASASSASSTPSAGPASSTTTHSSSSGAGSLRVPAAVAGFVGLAAAALL